MSDFIRTAYPIKNVYWKNEEGTFKIKQQYYVTGEKMPTAQVKIAPLTAAMDVFIPSQPTPQTNQYNFVGAFILTSRSSSLPVVPFKMYVNGTYIGHTLSSTSSGSAFYTDISSFIGFDRWNKIELAPDGAGLDAQTDVVLPFFGAYQSTAYYTLANGGYENFFHLPMVRFCYAPDHQNATEPVRALPNAYTWFCFKYSNVTLNAVDYGDTSALRAGGMSILADFYDILAYVTVDRFMDSSFVYASSRQLFGGTILACEFKDSYFKTVARPASCFFDFVGGRRLNQFLGLPLQGKLTNDMVFNKASNPDLARAFGGGYCCSIPAPDSGDTAAKRAIKRTVDAFIPPIADFAAAVDRFDPAGYTADDFFEAFRADVSYGGTYASRTAACPALWEIYGSPAARNYCFTGQVNAANYADIPEDWR